MYRRNKMSEDMTIEEMLKSIKGIISSHQKPKNDADILELTEIVTAETKNTYQHQTPLDSQQKIDQLINSAVINESLANIKNYIKQSKEDNLFEKKLTAEDLLLQLLKPQLKEWLDKNLPQLIEPLLKKEIEELIPNIKNKIR